MTKRCRNYKSLCLFIVSILVVSLMMLPPLLASCAPAVTDEKGALPQQEAASPALVDTGVILQEGNNLARTQLRPKQSPKLEDNRIGDYWHGMSEFSSSDFEYMLDNEICGVGLKWVRLAYNSCDSPGINWHSPEFSIDPAFDEWVTDLAKNDIEIMYVLSFWDKELGKRQLDQPRFRTEEDIERYLQFVQYIVHHFKNRVEYFELWNEPNCGKECLTLEECLQHITVEDYTALVKRAVPVIRQEYPDARVVVGAVSEIWEQQGYEYLTGILNPEIMPLVDAISWHPMYGTSPEHDYWRDYYYKYPSLVQHIKDRALANGFKGEFIAEELTWFTKKSAPPGEPWHSVLPYTEVVASKYYARAIVAHLGMDIKVGACANWAGLEVIRSTVRNLCTIMAGAKPISLPLEIRSEATNIRSYTFSLPNGDKLLALWTDGVAVDYDPGIEATVTLPGISAQKVTGIDVLNGFEQELITSTEGENLVIRNLLVTDYPIILRLTP